jgi:3-oxoadipate enol-lactonase
MTQHLIQHKENQLTCEVRGSGLPLVLIHGFPFDHTMWRHQIETLSQVCQVIAPDLRGFGGSSLTAADVADGVEMRRYADDIRAVLDDLQVEQPAILCGFSMGGYVLWQLALEFPEVARAIVLCDTRADADSTETQQAREQMAETVLRDGTDAVPGAMLPRLLAAATISGRQEIVDKVATMIGKSSPETIAAAQRGMARRPDVSGRLGEIDCPALIVVGAEDAISSPTEMREIAAALPSAEVVEIPDAGHMTPLENPAAVNEALLRFVQTL